MMAVMAILALAVQEVIVGIILGAAAGREKSEKMERQQKQEMAVMVFQIV